jgi:hypothetical protein
VDHLGQDRAGQVRLAGARPAEQQQTSSALAHPLEPVRVGAAYLQRLPLPLRPRQVALEGPIEKPPRNPAAPDSTLKLPLGGTTPVVGEPGGLALADRGQLLSGGQRG